MSYLSGYSWRRRWPVRIGPQASGAASVQIPLMLFPDMLDWSNLQSDLRDLRITLEDGSTLVSYWVDTSSLKFSAKLAVVWIKLTSLPRAGTLWLWVYGGNGAATAVSSFDAVFDNEATASRIRSRGSNATAT
jgi:hypothetical protein